MRLCRSVLVGVVVAALLGTAAVSIWRVRQQMHESASRACMVSLHAGLLHSPVEEVVRVTTRSAAWTNLSKEKVKQLVDLAAKARSLDCHTWSGDGAVLDMWRNPIEISIRWASPGAAEFRVWSTGADGVADTADDVDSLSPPEPR